MIQRCRATGVRARLSVRHVDDLLNVVLACRLSKYRGCFNGTLRQRIAEVGAVDAPRRTTDIFDVQHVADHDFRAQLLQRLGTVVLPSNESYDRVAMCQQQANRGSARGASGTSDEKFLHIDLW